MITFLSIVTIIVGVLLCITILLQNSKGGGLSAGLGSLGTGTQVFGVRRASDALSKATVFLSAIFLLLCIVMEIVVVSTKDNESGDSILQRQTIDQQTLPTEVDTKSSPVSLPDNK